jgi:hypothetical protein
MNLGCELAKVVLLRSELTRQVVYVGEAKD